MVSEDAKPSIFRRVQHPLVTLMAIGVLVLSVLVIRSGHSMSAILDAPWGRGWAPVAYARSDFIVAEGAEYRLIDTDRDSMDEATRLLRDKPEKVWIVEWHEPVTHRRGLYAPTEAVTTVGCLIYSAATQRPPDAVSDRRIREVFLSHLRQAEGGRLISTWELLERGADTKTKVLPSGYVHNIASGMALVVFAVSLGWVPRSRRMYLQWRQRRAAKHGVCVQCGYALAGLKTGACPECGTAAVSTSASK